MQATPPTTPAPSSRNFWQVLAEPPAAGPAMHVPASDSSGCNVCELSALHWIWLKCCILNCKSRFSAANASATAAPHGKPVTTAAAFEAIEIAYRLLRFVETLWARHKPPGKP